HGPLSLSDADIYSCSFFFQAEDGIRDFHVTGVQTCALPISGPRSLQPTFAHGPRHDAYGIRHDADGNRSATARGKSHQAPAASRSEERRVGKECRSRGWA